MHARSESTDILAGTPAAFPTAAHGPARAPADDRAPRRTAGRIGRLRRRLLAATMIAAAAAAVGATAARAAPGELDLRFGEDGVLFIDATGGHDSARALAALPDGSLLVAGVLDQGMPDYDEMVVLKLTPDGALDPAFAVASQGRASVSLSGDQDAANALLVLPDGRFVVAGALEPSSHTDFGVARFHADGRIDGSFGEVDPGGGRLGYVSVNVGNSPNANDYATALARLSLGANAGKLVVAGSGIAPDGQLCCYRRFGLMRLNTDGTVDTTFGPQPQLPGDPPASGIVVTAPTAPGAAEFPTAIATRADGSLPGDKITVVGYVFPDVRAIIRRYHADGSLDTSFDSDGTLVIEDTLESGSATGLGRIDAALYQPDGKLLLVGRARDRGFTFMRLNANGSRDASFGSNGRRSVKFSDFSYYDQPSALALQPNGKIVAAGLFSAEYDGQRSNDFAVVRLLHDGSLDSGFGDGGWSTYPLVLDDDEAAAVAVMPHGAIIAAGRAERPGSPNLQDDMAFLRLQGDSDIFADGFEAD